MNKNTIAIVSGSTRNNSQSLKVSKHLQAVLAVGAPGSDVRIIDLAEVQLPLWDEQLWDLEPNAWHPGWGKVSEILKVASGIVIVSPEWGGMVPGALKNFFSLCGGEDLAHKPGLIVSISSGTGGAYPVSELRMSSYKNTHICYIPTHVIVRHVEDVLNEIVHDATTDDPRIAEADAHVKQRIAYALDIFIAYVEGMGAIRAKALPRLHEHPYGM